MKISYNWLKNYVDLDISPEELSPILTDIGLEVEGSGKFEIIKGGLEGIVIGEVLTAEKHPNADKLILTTVDVGFENPLSIVCGAPNVEAGQKVIVAVPGTKLYFEEQSFEIKKTKIRGEVSEGMICAEDEVGLGTSHEGIMILDPEAKTGIPARDYFQITDDYVFEIGLTPNRSDAISHIGVARDIVAALNQKTSTKAYQLLRPSVSNFKIDNNDLSIDVIVEDPIACPRYAGITIKDIKVTESPAWLRNYLTAIGVRPINNIVDITNFVLFEYGQPLHAFDAGMISGGKVIVKKLEEGTTFVTLDEINRHLSSNDLMICDSMGGMCIGGVFGGINSGINEHSTSIFLESACFNPGSIRKTAKFHGLQTDASFRFERGVDPNITIVALKRATLLIKEIAGGTISSSISDIYPHPIEKWPVAIKYTNVDRLIGKPIERDTIKSILNDLEIEIKQETPEGLDLLIPTFKVDVTREADVIEEILRIYGYNKIDINNTLVSSLSYFQKPDPEKIQNIISDYLTYNGFYEIMNNSLITSGYSDLSKVLSPEHDVRMKNPLSADLDVLRQSLLFGGLEVIAYNQNRKNPDIRMYEFGTVYSLKDSISGDPLSKYHEEKHLAVFLTGDKIPESWYSDKDHVSFYDLKAYINNIFMRSGISIDGFIIDEDVSGDFENGLCYKSSKTIIAELGAVTRHNLDKFEITNDVFYAYIRWDKVLKLLKDVSIQYKETPKFPAVRRDLALMIDKQITFDQLRKLAIRTEKHLLKSVSIFDVYEGGKIEGDKKSYALSFILQDPRKTLTDKLIDKTMNKLMEAFKKEFNATIR